MSNVTMTASASEIAELNTLAAQARTVHALNASDAVCRVIDTLGLEEVNSDAFSATYRLESGRLVNVDFSAGQFDADVA